ncbi:hypothetical protein M3P21_08705 [Ruegeria sp. 2012CJ41-6]|uniref:Sulfotransferase family protein n=1 Tax=Ruegeria spongiae TaxID=2942209 RepID=A0ABT0Q159_9RHOB|nr:hypothetical protein [Ruegeria spongiae]MCL6283615.1 hypothetical protein [Ruegeria spongiae]
MQRVRKLPTLCLLHVGKTGGTYLRNLAREDAYKQRNIVRCIHGDTLETTAQQYGDNRKLAFSFRDPAERFVSAFYSRQRQGRPRYQATWTPGEAIAFKYFETPQQILSDLKSCSEVAKSAAHFALAHIQHIKLGYVHYFHSATRLLLEHQSGNILLCIETPKISMNLLQISTALRDLPINPSSDNLHANPLDVEQLDESAHSTMRDHFGQEYKIFEAARQVAKDIGFA